MALTVLDASVLIAWLDPSDALHAGAAAALRRHVNDDFRIPASAYSESLVGPFRREQLQVAKRALSALLGQVVDLTAQIAEEGAQLRANHGGLRLPDALVVATASVLGADAILTGDARWSRLAAGVEVVR